MQRSDRLWPTTALLAAALIAPGAAEAHHSFAMFEPDKVVTLDGTVREFQWTNPHVFIEVMVPERGKTVEYSLECASINGHRRRGWTRNSFKPGDHVKVSFRPLRDTSKKGGAFVKAVFADGRILYVGDPPRGAPATGVAKS